MNCDSDKKTWRRIFVPSLLIPVLILTSSYALFYLDWNFDDGYIVYRIVDNLMSGNGWTYNIGENVNASTSVLNTVLIWAFASTGFSIPVAAHLVGALGVFLAGYFAALLFKESFSWGTGLILGLLTVSSLSENSTWGVETHLFSGLLITVLYFIRHNTTPWFLLGLLILTRPDGVLVFGLAVMLNIIQKRRIPICGPLLTVLVTLPWVIFSVSKFGQIFPDTLKQKMWQGSSGYWGSGLVYLKALLKHVRDANTFLIFTYIAAALGVFCGYFSKSAVPLRSCLGVFLIFVLAQQLAYIILNVPGYHWYFSLFDLSALVFAMLLIAILTNRFIEWCSNNEQQFFALIQKKRIRIIASSVVSIYLLIPLQSDLDSRIRDARDVSYEVAAKGLLSLNQNPKTIGALEVGTTGYRIKQAKIVDLVGLTSANPEYVSGKHIDKFWDDPPQYVVLHEPIWHFERALFDDPRFLTAYQQIMKFPAEAVPSAIYEIKPDIGSPDKLAKEIELRFPKIAVDTSTDLTNAPSLDALCIVDQLNGVLNTPGLVLTIRPLSLTVRGWAVVQNSPDPTPKTIKIILKGNAGKTYSVTAKRFERQDVAENLKDPKFIQSGFEATTGLIDIEPGEYELLISQGELSSKNCGPLTKLVVQPKAK